MADEPTPDTPPRISAGLDMVGGTRVRARTKDQLEYGKDPCCHNLSSMSATASEPAKSGFYASVGIDPATLPDPLVNFSPVQGTYSIQSVVLFYCPWCGAELPRPPTA